MTATCERDFVQEAIRVGVRVDGREIDDIRRIQVRFGATWGECEVLWGTTRVFAVVSAEVVEPYMDRPTEGSLTFNVELCATANPEYSNMRNPEMAIELGRMLERFLKESRAVDREALCIVAHHHVWSIKCDVQVMNEGGNVHDACNVCALLALLHSRRPVALPSPENPATIKLFSEDEREPVPLSIHYLPISVTFAFFNNGELAVIDPIDKEEAASEGRLTVTLNTFQDVCAMQKNGGVPVDATTILQCVQRAIPKVKQITQFIEDELKKDMEKRLEGRGCISRPPPKEEADVSQIAAVKWGEPDTPLPTITSNATTTIAEPKLVTNSQGWGHDALQPILPADAAQKQTGKRKGRGSQVVPDTIPVPPAPITPTPNNTNTTNNNNNYTLRTPSSTTDATQNNKQAGNLQQGNSESTFQAAVVGSAQILRAQQQSGEAADLGAAVKSKKRKA